MIQFPNTERVITDKDQSPNLRLTKPPNYYLVELDGKVRFNGVKESKMYKQNKFLSLTLMRTPKSKTLIPHLVDFD